MHLDKMYFARRIPYVHVSYILYKLENIILQDSLVSGFLHFSWREQPRHVRDSSSVEKAVKAERKGL